MGGDIGPVTSLTDLIDPDQIEPFVTGIAEVAGIAIGILAPDGRALLLCNSQTVCVDFHLAHPATRSRCILAEPSLVRGLDLDDACGLFACGNGLTYAVSPIYLEGRRVGSAIGGQFFLTEPDMDRFRAQAAGCGFNEAAYLAAVRRIPILTEQRVRSCLRLVAGIAEHTGTMGQNVIRLQHLVTQRQEAERSLRRLQHAVDHAADHFFSIAPDGSFTYVNDSAARSLQLAPQELIGKTPWDIDPSFSADRWPAHWDELRRKGTIQVEAQHRGGDGRTFPVEIVANHVVFGEEEFEFAYVRDITLRKRGERRLEETLERLRLSRDAAVKTLARIVSIRDPYTAGHQERVMELTLAIATRMGLRKRRLESLRIAALVHDLGKIAVPAETLSKPGPLSKTEHQMIQQHPKTGYDILHEMHFPGPVASIVHQHHERLNGSGYPLGLAGEQIRVEARIIAVADVVEAMSSHRPYRPALGTEAALAEVESKKGDLYDPVVVDACLALFRDEGFTFPAAD